MKKDKLGIGFIGSGFITRFHMQSWIGVREADVRGVWSPNLKHAEETAALGRSLRVGDAKAFATIEAMVEISAIWPMLMAGMIQFSGKPICARNGLVHWK